MPRRRREEEPAPDGWKSAARRVGTTPTQQLRWLLAFASSDLRSLSHDEVTALETQIVVFERAADPVAIEGDTVQLISGDEVKHIRALHAHLNTMLNELLTEGTTHYTVKSMKLSLFREGGQVTQGMSSEDESQFMLAVFHVFALEGSRLKHCRDGSCGRLFVVTKRQEFCSGRCAQRVRTARFRERNLAAVKRHRREAHVRKQQKRFGPNVKVEQRPR